MELIEVNDYLSFIIEPRKGGAKITCLYEGKSFAIKGPCPHNQCIVKFISEMTLAVKQLRDMESVFEPNYHPN